MLNDFHRFGGSEVRDYFVSPIQSAFQLNHGQGHCHCHGIVVRRVVIAWKISAGVVVSDCIVLSDCVVLSDCIVLSDCVVVSDCIVVRNYGGGSA